MPTPNKGEDKEAYLQRCIPIVLKEGTAKSNDQAVAICSSMFEDHHKKTSSEEETKTFARNLLGVDIFASGKWNNDNYTEKDLDSMVEAFGKAPIKPPVKLGHDENQKWFGQKDGAPALGWVENLRRVGNKLVGDLMGVPNLIANLISNKHYRTKSAEIYWNYTDPTGKVWPRVLKAVSLLGADLPAVTSLDDLRVSLLSNNADGATPQFTVSDGAVDVKWYTYEYPSTDGKGGHVDMTAEQERKYTDEIAALKSQLTEVTARADSAEARAVKAEAALLSRDEKHAMEQFTAKVESLVKAEKVLPAEKDGLIRTFSALGAGVKKFGDKEFSPREDFVKSLEARPVIAKFSEVAKGEETEDVPPAERVDALTKKFMSDKKITYTEALACVKTEHPDVWAEYLKG